MCYILYASLGRPAHFNSLLIIGSDKDEEICKMTSPLLTVLLSYCGCLVFI